jgi:hypothetical protein
LWNAKFQVLAAVKKRSEKRRHKGRRSEEKREKGRVARHREAM